jgi:hypothetical protein
MAEPEVAPLPPLEDRGTAANVPLPPGQANAVLPLESVDPAFNALTTVTPAQGSGAPPATAAETPTAEPAPQTTSRPRRAVRRHVPAGEQVLRALQNY